ncbi:MAG: phosphatase PAP2 family protein [bacterium]|nr:phosphatase PAP2 family protein [bacterium]
MNFDVELFRWLNSWAGVRELWDTLIIFRTEWLGYWVGGALGLFLIFGKEKKRELRMVFEALAASLISRFVFTEIIRYFYNRPRPFEVLQDIYQLVQYDAGGSFPSGHAAFFFALAASVFFYHRVWGIIFFLAALSIGLGRVSAGIHWPSDILGGAVVGILTSFLVNYFIARFKSARGGI